MRCDADSETFHFGGTIWGWAQEKGNGKGDRQKTRALAGYGNEEWVLPFNELKLNVCMMEISLVLPKFSLLAWVIGLPNEFVICRAEAAKSGGRINKLDKRSDGQNRVTCRRRTNELTVYCWTHSLGIGQGSSDTITYSRLFSLMFDCDEEQRSIWIVGTTKIHVSITQSGTSVVFPGDVGHLEFLFKTKSQKLFISAFSSTFPRKTVLQVGENNKFPSICNNTNLAIK